MQIERCKGCTDLSAQDMLRFRSVEAAFQETAKSYGYDEVRTPTLEYLYLFTSAGTLTTGMLRRVYSFLDWDGWSGERVVLKPDTTIPTARLYIEQMQQQGYPARLSYVTNSFVFEESATKARERWQCGAELIGAGGDIADAELISFACDAVKRMGIEKIEVRLSHVGLLRGLLASLGLNHTEQDDVLSRILDGELSALESMDAAKRQSLEALRLLLNTKGDSVAFLKNLRSLFASDIAGVQDELSSFITTVEMIESMGLAYQIDFTCGKGFEYYTGMIFRLFAGEVNVGGGGRYDKLVETMGGTSAPAAGFGLYIDRLSALINIDHLYIPVSQRVNLCVAPNAMKVGCEVADLLRRAGLVVLLGPEGTVAHDCGWELQVKQDEPQIVLLNCATGERNNCSSAIEAVALVGLV
ncbi:MAG: histidine--tRNA ligase family protein [Dehalococcoidia bacterium]|nr:histidine--tRNA ligase family protein [Dehalococcoidia bacterium]